jgi:hypothetical protein
LSHLLHEERTDRAALGDQVGVVELRREESGVQAFGLGGLAHGPDRAEIVVQPAARGDDEKIDVRLRTGRLVRARDPYSQTARTSGPNSSCSSCTARSTARRSAGLKEAVARDDMPPTVAADSSWISRRGSVRAVSPLTSP